MSKKEFGWWVGVLAGIIGGVAALVWLLQLVGVLS